MNWRTLLSFAIVVGGLYLAVTKLHLKPEQIAAAIQHANMWVVLAAFLIYYLSFLFRSARWRLLLENAGFTKAAGVTLPGLAKLGEIIYLSWFVNVIVPAKLGDIYRAYLLRKNANISASRTLGTILAERILDLIILMLMFIPAVLLSIQTKLPHFLQLALEISILGIFVLIGGLFIAARFGSVIRKLVPHRVKAVYIHFEEGTLHSFRRIPQLTAFTFAIWCCEAGRFFFIALSLSLFGNNAPLVHVALLATFIALGASLLTTLPLTGGGIGVVEGGMAAMLALELNTSLIHLPETAFAAILIDRLISYLSILFIGLVVFLVSRETK